MTGGVAVATTLLANQYVDAEGKYHGCVANDGVLRVVLPGTSFVGANLRTSITRACKATGTAHFSPHGLRKRRGSLLSKQGYSLAEISERLGDTKVVTAEHYLYALGDYTEADYATALAR